MRIKIAVSILAIAWSTVALGDNGSWFGFSQEVKASWLFKVKSATVNYVQPDSEAEAKGVAIGDALVAVGNCEIHGCSTRKARQLMDLPVGEVQTFVLRRRGGEQYTVRLIAVRWPGD